MDFVHITCPLWVGPRLTGFPPSAIYVTMVGKITEVNHTVSNLHPGLAPIPFVEILLAMESHMGNS